MASIYQDKEDGNWLMSQLSVRKDTITYAATVTFVKVSATAALRLDAAINRRYMAATGACTFAAPVSGLSEGVELHFEILCDGTDRTMTFGTGFAARGTLAIESATTAIIAFKYSEANTSFIEMYRSVTVAS
jgi:hypothetical protein